MMTLKQQRDIIQAAMDGKKIECNSKINEKQEAGWFLWPTGVADFNFNSLDYRIKPEPRDFCIKLSSNGMDVVGGHYGLLYPPACPNMIHVREVLD